MIFEHLFNQVGMDPSSMGELFGKKEKVPPEVKDEIDFAKAKGFNVAEDMNRADKLLQYTMEKSQAYSQLEEINRNINDRINRGIDQLSDEDLNSVVQQIEGALGEVGRDTSIQGNNREETVSNLHMEAENVAKNTQEVGDAHSNLVAQLEEEMSPQLSRLLSYTYRAKGEEGIQRGVESLSDKDLIQEIMNSPEGRKEVTESVGGAGGEMPLLKTPQGLSKSMEGLGEEQRKQVRGDLEGNLRGKIDEAFVTLGDGIFERAETQNEILAKMQENSSYFNEVVRELSQKDFLSGGQREELAYMPKEEALEKYANRAAGIKTGLDFGDYDKGSTDPNSPFGGKRGGGAGINYGDIESSLQTDEDTEEPAQQSPSQTSPSQMSPAWQGMDLSNENVLKQIRISDEIKPPGSGGDGSSKGNTFQDNEFINNNFIQNTFEGALQQEGTVPASSPRNRESSVSTGGGSVSGSGTAGDEGGMGGALLLSNFNGGSGATGEAGIQGKTQQAGGGGAKGVLGKLGGIGIGGLGYSALSAGTDLLTPGGRSGAESITSSIGSTGTGLGAAIGAFTPVGAIGGGFIGSQVGSAVGKAADPYLQYTAQERGYQGYTGEEADRSAGGFLGSLGPSDSLQGQQTQARMENLFLPTEEISALTDTMLSLGMTAEQTASSIVPVAEAVDKFKLDPTIAGTIAASSMAEGGLGTRAPAYFGGRMGSIAREGGFTQESIQGSVQSNMQNMGAMMGYENAANLALSQSQTLSSAGPEASNMFMQEGTQEKWSEGGSSTMYGPESRGLSAMLGLPRDMSPDNPEYQAMVEQKRVEFAKEAVGGIKSNPDFVDERTGNLNSEGLAQLMVRIGPVQEAFPGMGPAEIEELAKIDPQQALRSANDQEEAAQQQEKKIGKEARNETDKGRAVRTGFGNSRWFTDDDGKMRGKEESKEIRQKFKEGNYVGGALQAGTLPLTEGIDAVTDVAGGMLTDTGRTARNVGTEVFNSLGMNAPGFIAGDTEARGDRGSREAAGIYAASGGKWGGAPEGAVGRLSTLKGIDPSKIQLEGGGNLQDAASDKDLMKRVQSGNQKLMVGGKAITAEKASKMEIEGGLAVGEKGGLKAPGAGDGGGKQNVTVEFSGQAKEFFQVKDINNPQDAAAQVNRAQQQDQNNSGQRQENGGGG